MSGYATFVDGKYTSVDTDPTGKTAVTTIRPGDSATGTIEVLNVASDKALSISAKGTSNFTDLTISRINVAETGSATLNIAGAQVVRIGGASGTVNFSVSGAGAGELIFNGNGAYGNYSTSTDNYTRKIKVTNSSIVTFDTINNSWGMGAIDIDAASELKATSIILKSGDNKGGDLQGGKITGDGSANVTTLTVGNVGNYTINVANFEAGTLNADWVEASKQLTLSSSTLTIGALNQTNGTIKITSATSAAITSLNISGGIIDASEMTGTLTISGATWTGGLAAASVEVLKAKDADTATSLAAVMDSTHGLSYRFSADGSSVYRTLRTEYYRTLTATTNANDSSRIVIGSIVYDGKTFTNVALKDLVAGDKVTLGTAADEEAGTAAQDLTGWIGYNNDIILADLEFAAGTTTHVNDGNAGGTITYSGAITGTGTLSFDWSGKTNTYVFTGDLSGFTGTIKDDATLNVTIGGTPATDAAKEVNATIDIAGALTVNREASFTKAITVGGKLIVKADSSIAGGTVTGNMDLKSGALTINGNVTLNGELDMKGGESTGGACLGHVVISETGKLKVNGKMWVLANSAKILLKEGGSLEWNGLTFTGQAEKADVDTGLTFGSDAQLSLTDAHFATNASIALSETGEKTLSWTLAGCSIDVRNGTLNVNGSNTNTALSVSSGSVVFTSSTSLTDSTVSGGNLQFNGSQTTLNGTLTISGGVAENTATGDNEEIRLGKDGKVSIVSGSLINDGFTYRNNGADASITGNGQNTLKVYEGSVVLKDVVMEKTVSADKGIGIAMDNVSLIVNGGTTTLRKDGEGRTQSLSSATVGSDATLKVENGKVSFGTVSVSGKLVVEEETKITGAATISGTAEVKGTLSVGADSSITTLTGSGTLKATGGTTEATNASGFTGTLEAAGGSLTASGGIASLTAVKATGGNITLQGAADLTLTEVVVSSGKTISAWTGGSQFVNFSAKDVRVGEGGGSLIGNLSINNNGTLTLNAVDGTSGTGLSLSYPISTLADVGPTSTSGSLTLGSGLTLNLLNLNVKQGESLTLFSGVTSVNGLSDDDLGKLTAGTLAAEDVFSGVGTGDFNLSYSNNIVALVAQRDVPEPTTATLSLLALMGLAARRRRRKA